MTNIIKKFDLNNISYKIDEPMCNHTSFKTGGNAAVFVPIDSEDKLYRVLALCKEENKDIFVLGKGSNLLVSDEGIRDRVVVHISTDFVFDGNTNKPYMPSDETLALNIYGDSKLTGEKVIKNFDNTLIIRTSWLYSEYGKNFFKTMYNRIKNGQLTKVVNDQIGTPTYARDLANFIIDLVEDNNIPHDILHFSNQGCCSWYDFAKAIEIEYNRFDECEFIDGFLIQPISSYDYMMQSSKLLSTRPAYSVLSKEYTEKLIGKPIRHWLEAMNECFIRNI